MQKYGPIICIISNHGFLVIKSLKIFLCKQCPGSALFNYCKYTRACTKGVYLEQACTKCTYNRHIAIKQEKDIHEVGDEAVEKHM